MIYQVAIVEDDPMITLLNRSFIEKDARFAVCKEFRDGRSALRWLEKHSVDLLVLDVYMPIMTGLELLKQLRTLDVSADAIMVTAANDAKTVDALLKLGITDYLVKPFSQERFQQALDNFCRHREAIHGTISQQALDTIFAQHTVQEPLPKGLQEQTLQHLCQCLSCADAGGSTSDALAAAAGLSVVTVRRYMNYLVERGDVGSRINYDTGGRPSVLYFLKTAPHFDSVGISTDK